MEYKVVTVSAVQWAGTDFEKAAESLASRVNEFLTDDWEPQGGISVGETQTSKEPYLFQAIVRRR